jgi:hypothetical protein
MSSSHGFTEWSVGGPEGDIDEDEEDASERSDEPEYLRSSEDEGGDDDDGDEEEAEGGDGGFEGRDDLPLAGASAEMEIEGDFQFVYPCCIRSIYCSGLLCQASGREHSSYEWNAARSWLVDQSMGLQYRGERRRISR